MTEVISPAPMRPTSNTTVASSGQAVKIDGRSYDVCVRVRGSNRVLLLVEKFEDVSAPGLLTQAVEAKAGCTGYLEDSEGFYWPSVYPLACGGCFVFTPHPTKHGIGDVVEKYLQKTVVQLARAFTTAADPAAKRN